MSGWTPDELERIDAEDELTIRTRRRDGTLRAPVTDLDGSAWATSCTFAR